MGFKGILLNWYVFWCDKFLSNAICGHLPVHLDCLPDTASGPCSTSRAVGGSKGFGCILSVGVLVGWD